MPTARLFPALATLALIIGLVFPTVLPEVGNVGVLVLAGLAILLFWRRARWGELLRRPGIVIPLVAGAILTLCFAVTADEPWHAFAAIFFVPLFLAAPVAAVLRAAPRVVTPQNVGLAALAGTAAGVAVALYDSLVLGMSRAGYSVNNPIHLADLSLMLGFAALVGVYGERRWVRYAVLAGPVLALVVVLLSGSRGPLLAFVPMLLVALAILLAHQGWRYGKWTVFAGGGVICVVLAAFAWNPGAVESLTAFSDIAKVLRNEMVDNSTSQRLVMYQSAYNAFLASPVFGHGLIGYVQAAARYVPAGVEFPVYGHLHNDIADFAVAGGGLGLAALALFLLAPIAEALRRPRAWPAVHLALTMSVGYFAMGLTNAMLGILTQTVLYGFCLALVVHFSMQAPDGTEPAA